MRKTALPPEAQAEQWAIERRDIEEKLRAIQANSQPHTASSRSHSPQTHLSASSQSGSSGSGSSGSGSRSVSHSRSSPSVGSADTPSPRSEAASGRPSVQSYPLPQSRSPQSRSPQSRSPQSQLPQSQSRVTPAASGTVRASTSFSPGATGSGASADSSSFNLSHLQLATLVERLQQQSNAHLQQFRQLQTQPSQPTADRYLQQALGVLETQVNHINQIAATQEAALLDFKAIAEQVEQRWQALEQDANGDDGEIESLGLCEYEHVAIPEIEQFADGSFVIRSRSLDLFKAEREAEHTAQALRHLTRRGRSAANTPSSRHRRPSARSTSTGLFTGWRRFFDALLPAEPAPQFIPSHSSEAMPLSSPQSVTTQRSRSSHHRSQAQSHRPSQSFLNLREGLLLVIGATIARVILDAILVSFPMLWAPMILLLATPTAVAVYQTSRTPQSGFIWGYRLLFIMIGLLLGGRL